MSDGSVKIEVDILKDKAEKELDNLVRIVEEHGDVIDENLKLDADNMVLSVERAKSKVEDLTETHRKATQELERYQNLEIKHLGLRQQLRATDSLDPNYDKLTASLEQAGRALDRLDHSKITREVERSKKALDSSVISYEMLTNRAGKLTNRIQGSVDKSKELEGNARKVRTELERTSQLDVASGISKGIRTLGRYAGALFGIRTAYNLVRNLSNEWLNSESQAAQQAKANIQAMTSMLANALAPVIIWVTNLLGTMFGYLAAILKFFFGIDITANSTAKATKGTAKNTSGIAKSTEKARKEAEKFLASFDKAEVVSSNIADNTGGGGGSGSGGSNMDSPMMPNLKFDNSVIDNLLDKLKSDLMPFLETLRNMDLEPLKASFERLGEAVKGLAVVVYESFIRMMNEAVAPFIKIMVEEIVPRAINAVAKALEMLTPHFEYVLKNLVEPFVKWVLTKFVPAGLNLLIATFELLIPIVDKALGGMKIWWKFIEPVFKWIGDVAVEAIKGITKSIEELTGKVERNEDGFGDLFVTMGIIIGAFLTFKGAIGVVNAIVAIATPLISALTTGLSALWGIAKIVAGFFAGAFTGSVAAIVAVVAVLGAALLGLVTNFDQVKRDFMVIVNNIRNIFWGLYDFIAGVFTGNWSRAFYGLSNAVSNAFAGLFNIVKFPINLIVDGINYVIRGLNNFRIPSWVPGVGGRGIFVPTIPRLARGTYANSGSLQAIIGESGKEAVVPLENNTGWIHDFINLFNEHGGGSGGGNTTIKAVVDGKTLFEVNTDEERKNSLLLNGGMA